MQMVRFGRWFARDVDLQRKNQTWDDWQIHLLLTAATRTMRQEYLAGTDGFISMPHQAYCYDFYFRMIHSEDIQQLYDVARYVEDEARLHQRFEKLTVDDLAGLSVSRALMK